MQTIFESLRQKSFGVFLDRNEYTICKPGQSWLWGVHKYGTHLVRWNVDSELIYIELLLRAAKPDTSWHIFHVKDVIEGEPCGIVSGSLDPGDLKDHLLRCKRRAECALPGTRISSAI
jgi:hypothetical protein